MKIEIHSEEEAWQALEGLISGRILVDSVDDIVIGSWVKNTIYIPGERYDSALSAYMMQGWVEAQRSLYRSYALVSSGAADARTLTDLQKEKLELVVVVHSGSSDQEASLTDIIKEVLLGAVDKMDPQTIAIVLIALVLIWAGQAVWRQWISDKKEQRLAEISSETVVKALETVQVAVAGDHEKKALLEQAIAHQPVLADLKKEADGTRKELVKHTSNVDAEINGVPLSAEASSALSSTSRKYAEEERRDGIYKVLKVDTTVPNGFRVHIESVASGETMQAHVQEVMSSLNDRAVIQAAEWSKVPVELQINARVKDERVVDAVILRAAKYEPPE